MFTFFSVTGLLFEKIRAVLKAIFEASSIIAAAIALLFCIVLMINIFDNGINKKFFVNNKIFIFISLLLEAISYFISSNETLIKVNFFTIIIFLLIIFYKLSTEKKTTKKAGSKK